MTKSQELLLQCLASELFNRPKPIIEADLSVILQEACNQAVLQLVYYSLDTNSLSDDEVKTWKLSSSADIGKNIRVLHYHAILHKWMKDAGISYVILKGAASADYYPVATYRSMGDVDFLVEKKNLEKAGKVLMEHGLTPWDSAHISHIVYRGKRMHFEMHFNLPGMPDGLAGEIVQEYIKDIYEKAQETIVGTGTAMLPSPFHHGLILLLHTCHHLTGEGIGLRHLCDWAVFVNSFSEDVFRNLFENRLKAIGMWRFAQILTRASIKYLGADEKQWAEADDELVDALVEDILDSGNFGVKDAERSNQAYLISSRGKNGVGKTVIGKQLFISLNNVVYTRWASAKKWKVLLPIGWVYFGASQIIKIARGNRKKIHFRRMVEGAEQRRALYSQLHLYECET